MQKSKLFLFVLIFGALLSISIPKYSISFDIETEASSTLEIPEFPTDCKPLDDSPNSN